MLITEFQRGLFYDVECGCQPCSFTRCPEGSFSIRWCAPVCRYALNLIPQHACVDLYVFGGEEVTQFETKEVTLSLTMVYSTHSTRPKSIRFRSSLQRLERGGVIIYWWLSTFFVKRPMWRQYRYSLSGSFHFLSLLLTNSMRFSAQYLTSVSLRKLWKI